MAGAGYTELGEVAGEGKCVQKATREKVMPTGISSREQSTVSNWEKATSPRKEARRLQGN